MWEISEIVQEELIPVITEDFNISSSSFTFAFA
jgi:hypothetical protein